MESLALLFVLGTVAATAAAQEEKVLSVGQQFARLKEGECLPDDVTGLSVSGCQSETDLTQELQCIASSAGLSDNLGYHQAAGDAYIDGFSVDNEWTIQQKEHLDNCSSMTLNQVPTDKEGTFVLACWHQLMMSDCSRKKMVALVEAVDPINAKQLVEAVADLAEGPCFDIGLKYADELGKKWETCAKESNLDMNVLNSAAYHYILFSQRQDIPEATVENNNATREQLDRLAATRNCYAASTGEVTKTGEVNYALINEATRNAVGGEEFKIVDRAFVQFCQDRNPANIGEFYGCFNGQKPFACTVIKSYDIALGRQSANGASRMEASTVAPTAASIIAGLLSSIF